eukprot:14020028-Alexandrium_andersonii.AAC.1
MRCPKSGLLPCLCPAWHQWEGCANASPAAWPAEVAGEEEAPSREPAVRSVAAQTAGASA